MFLVSKEKMIIRLIERCAANFNEVSNTRSRPKTAEQRPKDFIRTTKYRVNGELMWTNINISAKI